MSQRAKEEHGAHRLVDIVVEEVSLVDRAANKHRFLIVKRSNDMDQSTTDDAATATSEADETQDLAADLDADETAAETGDVDDAGGGAAEVSGPLQAALTALEGLTETVELLGASKDGEATPRLVELASELKVVSDQLAGLTGEAPSRDGGGHEPTPREQGEPPKSSGTDPLADAVASIRSTLQRVSAVLDATGKDGGAASVPGPAQSDRSGGDASDGSSGDDSGDKVAGQLEALATALRTLTETVKEQQQRLGRIEKRFGLPNSAPSGERPARAEDEDVGWPLDLNRSFDRDSVDKSISFHDV